MKKHVILDTDIGLDPDDFVALLMLLNSENIQLDLIATNEEFEGFRARMVNHILRLANRAEINVVSGRDTWGIYLMGREYDDPININTNEEIQKVLTNNEYTYYLSIGGLSNLAKYLESYPYQGNFELIQMGGSESRTETNFSWDVDAAIYVFSQEIKTTLITSEITNNKKLSINIQTPLYSKVKESKYELFQLLYKNMVKYGLTKEKYRSFNLHDPLAATAIINDRFLSYKKGKVEFILDELGTYQRNKYDFCEKGNVNISIDAKYDEFLEYVVQLLDIK